LEGLIASPADALVRMSRQHDEIEGLLERDLTPCWEQLVREPGDESVRRSTSEAAKRLGAWMHDHLALEEASIFPVLAKLSPAELELIRSEIRARRT
jgi:hemerythrin-like domain-containing protein